MILLSKIRSFCCPVALIIALSSCGDSNSNSNTATYTNDLNSNADSKVNKNQFSNNDPRIISLANEFSIDDWARCKTANTLSEAAIVTSEFSSTPMPQNTVDLINVTSDALEKVEDIYLSRGQNKQELDNKLKNFSDKVEPDAYHMAIAKKCLIDVGRIIFRDNFNKSSKDNNELSSEVLSDSASTEYSNGTTPVPISTIQKEISLIHNGSLMKAFIVDNNLTILYSQPRSGLGSIGVKSGDTVFRGTFANGKVKGIAYTFKAQCLPAPYEVNGTWESEQIILSGSPPVRKYKNCDVTGYVNNSKNSTLIFSSEENSVIE